MAAPMCGERSSLKKPPHKALYGALSLLFVFLFYCLVGRVVGDA